MSGREYVTEEDKRRSSFAAVGAHQPCGGVYVNGQAPTCCETHVLPWGHAREASQ